VPDPRVVIDAGVQQVRNGPGASALTVILVPANSTAGLAGELDHGTLAGGVPGPGRCVG